MTRAPRLVAHWVRIRLTPPAPGVQQHGVALLDRIYGLDEQKFPRIQPRPEISVDEVHADRFGFDQHFTPTGGGPRLVDVPQDFGSTGCVDFDGVHGHDSNLALNTLSMKRGTTANA